MRHDVFTEEWLAEAKKKMGKPNTVPFRYVEQQYKSKVEVRFAQLLAARKFACEILEWHYEPFNFRLPGEKNYYKPDWLIVSNEGLHIVDTKGWSQGDDRSLVKMKVVAGMYTWISFAQARWIKGEWVYREVKP